MSSQPEPTFSHDLTLKSLFAERDMVGDLIRYHASSLFPELQGFEPTELAASSTVTTDPVEPPHQQGWDRDLVWTLARATAREDQVLLHLEFQSRPDAAMTLRMVDYAHGLFQRIRNARYTDWSSIRAAGRSARGGVPCRPWPALAATAFNQGPCWMSTTFRCRSFPMPVIRLHRTV